LINKLTTMALFGKKFLLNLKKSIGEQIELENKKHTNDNLLNEVQAEIDTLAEEDNRETIYNKYQQQHSSINNEINALIKERGATEDADEAKIYSDEWFRDVVSTSVNNGLTIDDVYKRLVENYDIGEIFKVAKEAGYAKVLTGKEKDIKRYLESLK